MVVEDELMIATTLEFALESKGYRVLGPVATVSEALALLETATPNIALIDYRLATTTTEALLPSLDSLQVSVCVLTGYNPDQLPPAYSEYTKLEKPFRLNTLMQALEKLISV
nr:response regulator [Rhodanobacter sp. A1T4]